MDGTYTVIVPSLPGCLTFGHSFEEALEKAKEAIEGFIESKIRLTSTFLYAIASSQFHGTL
jgi:predicted RNase H-like HicB family nuclease